MIPIKLYLSGFLSYREAVELDFTQFDLACIAGSNGAGKSSLLDAITWALFGQARKRDDSIINARCNAAEVSLTFQYEENIYRVQRIKPRDKTGQLEFQILQDRERGNWKALSERSLRETEARIQQTLRLDYETFVNAAFFLQGKADQFTQQRPGDRKRILSSILGLEIWENYRQGAIEHRKAAETEIAALDGRLQEILAELAEEPARKARLKGIEADLDRLSRERLMQESALENIRKVAATLSLQKESVDALHRQFEAATRRLDDLQRRSAARQREREVYVQKLGQAEAIRADHQAWQQARTELERWDEVSQRFRQQEKRREGPRDEIHAERVRLLQEQQALQRQQRDIEALSSEAAGLQSQLDGLAQLMEQTEAQLERRSAIEAERQTAQQQLTDLKAENLHLKAEMNELKARIDRLGQVEGAECPLCGQPLAAHNRSTLLDELKSHGLDKGNRHRTNQGLIQQLEAQEQAFVKEMEQLKKAEAALRQQHSLVGQLSSRIEGLEAQRTHWEQAGLPRWQEISAALEQETYAAEARARLAEIDAELKLIGYDAAAHDAVRREEQRGRSSESELRELEKAEAALAPLERELADLQTQLTAQQAELDRQRQDYEQAAASLAAGQAQAPDLYAAERALLDVQEQENRLRLEVGAARQKVLVLDDLKQRRKELEMRREEKARLAGHYKQLERSFGKDGVPALLIEQALPEIEAKSNEILDRLTGGTMTVRFVTQSAYKDKKRDDLKETLDILISDGISTRDYEMFSGGEAFRVNFAIRLALSEVLARRAGARLQTLVVDEGFGSQDAQGRQRLIEAINLVRPDFAKILVITHIDELKDAFPNRIEVEKNDLGSRVRVM